MADDPEGLVRFEAAGKKFTAVFGIRAMKATEAHYDLPFFRAIASAVPRIAPGEANRKKIAEAVLDMRFTDLCKLFEFGLLRFHRELTEDQIDDIVDEIGVEKVSEIVGQGIAAAMGKEGDESSDGNPPKRRRGRTG